MLNHSILYCEGNILNVRCPPPSSFHSKQTVVHQRERQAPATQFISFKATRIPSDQPQDQVQRIFDCHYPGALICLQKQKKRKSDFRSGHLTIPRNVVDKDQTLQRALASNDGVAIFPSPLPKIYLRPMQPEKVEEKQTSQSIKTLEVQIADIKSAILSQHQQFSDQIYSLQAQINQLQACLVQTPLPQNHVPCSTTPNQIHSAQTPLPHKHPTPLQPFHNRDHSRSYSPQTKQAAPTQL